jgi:WD40 repeat protein
MRTEVASVPANGFDVFISYSHAADRDIAPRLQSGLEKLAKPWFLRRALRVFRDETDLGANPDLWSAIEIRLESSRNLILLCSPEAAASQWVAREVDRWLELGRRESLLFVLTSGEIAWDDSRNDFDWSRTTAVPRNLQGRFEREPGWVDLRQGCAYDASPEAFTDVVARLAAPIRNLDLEKLVSADHREHRRTIHHASVAGVVLALLLVAASVFAVISEVRREEALKQMRTANAQRLATASRAVRDEQPETALLLSVAAIQATQQDEVVLSEAEQVLREALAVQGGHGLYGHDGPVTQVAISSDGQWIATAGEDKSVRLYNSHAEFPGETGRLVFRSETAIRAIGFSSGARWLVVADGGSAWLWEPFDETPSAKGRPLVESGLSAISISPLGRRVLVSDGAALTLWDLSDPDAVPEPTALGLGEGFGRVAYNADEDRVAANVNAEVLAWDLREGAAPIALKDASFAERGWFVDRLAFDPAGRLLAATVRNGSAFLWDLSAPGREPAFLPHPRPIKVRGMPAYWIGRLQFSPDGQWLATASSDASARIWDLSDPSQPEPTILLSGYDDNDDEYTPGDSDLTFTRDGTRLIVGGDAFSSGSSHVWEREPDGWRDSERNLPGRDHLVVAGDWLLAAGLKTAQVWDTRGGGPYADQGSRLAVTHGFLRGHAMSRDGSRVVLASGAGARVWDLGRAVPRETIAANRVRSRTDAVAVSESRRWLATLGDGRLRLWDLDTAGAWPRLFVLKAFGMPAIMNFAPGNRFLAVATQEQVWIWDLDGDLTTPSRILDVPPMDGQVATGHLALRPNASALALSVGARAWAWRLPPAAGMALPPIELAGHREKIEDLSFSADGRFVVTQARMWKHRSWWRAGQGMEVFLWDVSLDGARSDLGVAPEELHSFLREPQGRWIFARSSTGGSLWDLSEAQPTAGRITLAADPLGMAQAAFSADGRWLLTAGYGQREGLATRAWFLASQTPGDRFKDLVGYLGADHNTRQPDLSARVSRDGRWLVTSATDGRAWLHDLASGAPTRELPGHSRFADIVAFSADGRRLLTSEWGSMRVWELQDGDPALAFAAPQSVWGAAFAGNGDLLVTIADIRIWDLTSREPERSAIDLLDNIGGDDGYWISRNDRWLVASGYQSVSIHALGVETLLEIARATLGRNFTPQEWQVHFAREPYRALFPGLPVPEQDYDR